MLGLSHTKKAPLLRREAIADLSVLLLVFSYHNARARHPMWGRRSTNVERLKLHSLSCSNAGKPAVLPPPPKGFQLCQIAT